MERDFYTKKVEDFFRKALNEGIKGSPTKESFKKLKADRVRVLGLPIPRELVESGEVEEIVVFFENIKVTKDFYRNKVLFSISGYDYDVRELYEIPEVVDWIKKLVDRVPYIFYYIEESSWSFIQCSLANKVTSVSAFGDKIDVHEFNRRAFEGGDLPTYRNYLETDSAIVDKLFSSVKRLGAEINDLKGAMVIANALSKTYK